MLRLASDEDVHGDIVRGVRRHAPDIDLVRVLDAIPSGTPDPAVLEWAASEGRVLITDDANTMVGFAYARVNAGQQMPGLLVLRDGAAIVAVVEDIILIAHCDDEGELRDQVWFLPLST